MDRVGHVEPGLKRVRAYFGGEVVADTRHPLLVWERPQYPAYYLPASDVRMDLFEPCGTRGDARHFTIVAGGRTAEGAAWMYPDPPVEALRDHIRIDWAAMDHWFEEDEEVYVHVRSPYTRIDILPSSRHVEARVGGVTVAESSRPTLLFETGLPPRYYLPLVDLRVDLLRPSPSLTQCPYKGTASYWTVDVDGRVVPDAAWCYRSPLPESQRIAGLVAFYPDKVELLVDGERV